MSPTPSPETGCDSPGEISTRKAATHTRNGEMVLPQWLIDLLRPLVGVIGRVCWKLQHKGTENIPETGGLIVAANHQTYIDPFWVSVPIKRPVRYLAWDKALGWPVVGRILGLLGAWPLQLEGSDPTPIRRSLQWLRGGGVVVIFPEGGRGLPDGSMLRFKAGAVRMALEAGVPILPVTIRGGNQIWPAGRRLPRRGSVEVNYHQLFHVERLPGEETRVCAKRESERLAQTIASGLK